MKELRDESKPILLISCYELGHQPAGIAMPMAFIRREGFDVEAMDVSVQGFDAEKVARAGFVGISVPMHTALRLGVRTARRVRQVNPSCHICFYGLYASLNADHLLDTVADSVIGGEFEESLAALIKAIGDGGRVNIKGVSTKQDSSAPALARLGFCVPDRGSLPPLERYAKLEHRGEQRLVGYVEASRGCLHHCTHCPIPPVYNGRFFIVKKEVVLEDIGRLVGAGARHITFGDPDFLNGPRHSLDICRAMHGRFPDVTFDFTAKVEHVLKYRTFMPEMARLGCIFVVSAVESLSERVLARLEKGHTRDDIVEALAVLRDASISMRPSFVSFTPWTTVDDFIDVLEFVESYGLIDHVDPVQYSIRLLVPPGSLLLARPDTSNWLGRLAQESFTYEWEHPDPRMDELHKQVSALVEQAARNDEDPAVTFYRVRELAYQARGDQDSVRSMPDIAPLRLRPPRLTEAWFC
ncbi:MAG TPA: CUAEP/CCAEP-tail radical SAM protein [Blastocatellia bacterium]|jgi:radical SAM superfamily enzyme YgiQ (UPF0313 family)